MKKVILFLILSLGFITENKAQFAASSEIHYYIPADGKNNSVELVIFNDNKCFTKSALIYPNSESYDKNVTEERLLEAERSDFTWAHYYYPSHSTSKYFTYRTGDSPGDRNYSFSKDKNTYIYWVESKYGSYKFYYMRVSRNDILNIGKPNLDFLE